MVRATSERPVDKPTLFEKTYAARSDYKVFDLTAATPLLTSKPRDESKQEWTSRTKPARSSDGQAN